MNQFSVLEMLKAGWFVLSVLFFCSIFSVTILVDRLRELRKARLDAGTFIGNILKMLETGDMADAVAYCGRFSCPLARVVRAVLLTPGDRADKERVMLHTLRVDLRRLETYVPALGTIGSLAPFIGLFGTILGIIKAFRHIAFNPGGGPEIVASGIAEALVTTAAGLIVAIPAIAAYNYCLVKIRRLAEEVELYAYRVIETQTER